jgi:hypothetical protein
LVCACEWEKERCEEEIEGDGGKEERTMKRGGIMRIAFFIIPFFETVIGKIEHIEDRR